MCAYCNIVNTVSSPIGDYLLVGKSGKVQIYKKGGEGGIEITLPLLSMLCNLLNMSCFYHTRRQSAYLRTEDIARSAYFINVTLC